MRNTNKPNTITRLVPEWLATPARPTHGVRRGARNVIGSVALATAASGLVVLLQLSPARAVEFGENGYQGSLDTIISYGLTYRVEERDDTLANDVNGNDGELNYDRGIVSNVSKFTSDLDIRTDTFSAFVRATGFLDFENQSGERERTPLSDAAKERVGSDVEVLDAYVTAGFDASDMPVDVRLGRHVLNWGESTFIPNGINAVNPFDVSKLRRPGSELREALLPVGAASVAVAPTDTLSMEAFYQFDWDETRIDPVGSYFSSTDYAGPGAEKAVLIDIMDRLQPDPQLRDRGFGFGPLTAAINADLAAYTVPNPQTGQPIPWPQRPQAEFDEDFASVLRGADRTPDESGQWGMAVRYLSEELNDTEFGLYVINYHSRLPTVGAFQGDRKAVDDGLAAFGAVLAPGSATTRALTQEATAEVRSAVMAGVQAGQIDPAAAPGIIQQKVSEAVQGQLPGIAQALAVDRYAKSGTYFLEYPEDIQLMGLSFNTVLGASGWALQGEYSLRRDAPLQRAERRVLADGLSPIATVLGLAGAAGAAQAQAAALQAAGDLAGAQAAAQTAQRAGADLQAFLMGYSPNAVQGYVERDVSQIQATATKVFGPTMGADSLAFVMEAAVMHVHDMPDKDDQPLESPAGGVLATDEEADADATSWGYRVAARLDYNNVIGSINLFPYVQFLHDVSGNSPAPSGPFVEGRTALTLGVRADYLSRWQADVGFTRYAGDGNELLDRDFVSASVKYSF